MTNPLFEAVVALKHGYEVNEHTMYDDDMIGHAETLSGYHDELIDALAKAAALDEITKSLGAQLGPEVTASINAKIQEWRNEILASGPSAVVPKI